MKKILLTLGSVSAIITPVIAVVACENVLKDELAVAYEEDTRMLVISGIHVEQKWDEEEYLVLGELIRESVKTNLGYGNAKTIIIRGTKGESNFLKTIEVKDILGNQDADEDFNSLNDVLDYEYIDLCSSPTNAILGYRLIIAGSSIM